MSRIAPLLPFVLSLAAACTARGYSPSPTPTEDASQDLAPEVSSDASDAAVAPPNDVPVAPDAPDDMVAPPDLAPVDVVTTDTPPLDVIARDVAPPPPDVAPPPPDVPPPPPMDVPPPPRDVPPPPPDVPPPPRDVPPPPVDVPIDTGTTPPGRDEVWVVRVGDGTMSYSSSAAPVFIETYYGDTGVTSGPTIALPTAMAGAGYPLTLTGNASGEGTLSRSLDGRSVSLAGYSHAPGTATAPSARAPRVIARLSPARTIDTRTTITAPPFDTAAVRAAVSVDGSAFWTIHTNTSDGDVNYTLSGGASFTASVTNRLVLRSLVMTNSQLFATGALPTGSGVYATTTLPRTAAGATMALLPGFPVTASMSPYGLAVFDTDANGAIDTIFLADDRALASGGGLLCWRFTAGTWSQVGPVAGLTASLRGLTGRRNGTSYVFFATTAETRSRLVRIDVEAATLLGIETTLATSPMSTAYRGVAFAPR